MLIALDFIKRFWPYLIITLLLLVVGYFKLSNDKLEAKLDKAVAENSSLASSFDTLKKSTQECNQKVDELNRNGIALTTKLEDAARTIEGLKEESFKRIREIRNAQIPKDCPQALNYLVDEIKKSTKKWSK